MPIKRTVFIFLLLLSMLFTACSEEPQGYPPGVTVDNIPFAELGIPLAERYPQGDVARCAWDMILWEGKIYCGSGDYDLNLGPAQIFAYDLATKAWEHSGTVPDEEVSRFTILYDELATPGTDPQEDWELGNYYVLHDGTWEKHRVIPGGIHVFDIVEYDGMLFAGLGVVRGEYPIAISLDGGETFDRIPLKKDGRLVKTNDSDWVRVYDLFVFGDELYATFSYGSTGDVYELYRFDDEKCTFSYVTSWAGVVKRVKYKYARIGEKVIFDDTVFFTTGNLYRATDLANPEKITMPQGMLICDLCVVDDALYLLCGKKTEGGVQTSVLKLTCADGEFETLFNFVYDVPPMSFCIDGNDYYIGMGSGTSKNEKNGTLVHVNYTVREN